MPQLVPQLETRPVRVEALNLNEYTALRFLSHGLTVPMIAEQMSYSPHHVKHLIGNARMKLAAKNTAHAIAIAFRDGILS